MKKFFSVLLFLSFLSISLNSKTVALTVFFGYAENIGDSLRIPYRFDSKHSLGRKDVRDAFKVEWHVDLKKDGSWNKDSLEEICRIFINNDLRDFLINILTLELEESFPELLSGQPLPEYRTVYYSTNSSLSRSLNLSVPRYLDESDCVFTFVYDGKCFASAVDGVKRFGSFLAIGENYSWDRLGFVESDTLQEGGLPGWSNFFGISQDLANSFIEYEFRDFSRKIGCKQVGPWELCAVRFKLNKDNPGEKRPISDATDSLISAF